MGDVCLRKMCAQVHKTEFDSVAVVSRDKVQVRYEINEVSNFTVRFGCFHVGKPD